MFLPPFPPRSVKWSRICNGYNFFLFDILTRLQRVRRMDNIAIVSLVCVVDRLFFTRLKYHCPHCLGCTWVSCLGVSARVYLRINPAVAGPTLLAFGNGSPDVSATLIGLGLVGNWPLVGYKHQFTSCIY